MRNIEQDDTRFIGVLRALVAFLLWLFRFLSSPGYLVGFVIGLVVASSIFVDALNDWQANGGFAEACSQLDQQKQ